MLEPAAEVFVRCVGPNQAKGEIEFEEPHVQRQLKCMDLCVFLNILHGNNETCKFDMFLCLRSRLSGSPIHTPRSPAAGPSYLLL